MHENLLRSQKVFVKNVVNVCKLFGKDEEKGKIIAALYITEKALTKKELSEKLKIDMEKISKIIDKGMAKGFLREVKFKGSEDLRYEISLDICDIFMDTIKAMMLKKSEMTLKTVGECQELIVECEDELDENERVVGKLLYARLEHVRKINKFIYKILKGILLKDILDIDTSRIKKVKIG